VYNYLYNFNKKMNAEEGLEGGSVNVTISRKSKVHTNITVVENATRYVEEK
jgi:hypothetical protein